MVQPAPGPQAAAVAFGTVGLGGYGASISRLLEQQSREADPPVRLAAVFEPDAASHAPRLEELRSAGVRIVASYDELLSGPIEAVWLPLPIHLHRPFTEQALAAGKAVMCEKPAAGSVGDLYAMMAARDRARRPVAIGFQDMYDPATHEVKRRILEGAIGRPRSAALVACWPRELSYFSRNDWAGRFRFGDTWVMDSPASNALSHFVNLALFWLGEAPAAPAVPVAVEAELYRVNEIENYDTCSVRVHTAGGAELLILLTHACQRTIEPQITITGEAGTLTTEHRRGATLRDTGGEVIEWLPFAEHPHAEMVRRFAARVRGELSDDAVATLEQSEAHLMVINGASEATPVHPLPTETVEVVAGRGGEPTRVIRGIEEAFEECAGRGQLLSESSLVGWSVPPGRRALRGYRHFAGPLVQD